jgi:hypothetical protein
LKIYSYPILYLGLNKNMELDQAFIAPLKVLKQLLIRLTTYQVVGE